MPPEALRRPGYAPGPPLFSRAPPCRGRSCRQVEGRAPKRMLRKIRPEDATRCRLAVATRVSRFLAAGLLTADDLVVPVGLDGRSGTAPTGPASL